MNKKKKIEEEIVKELMKLNEGMTREQARDISKKIRKEMDKRIAADEIASYILGVEE